MNIAQTTYAVSVAAFAPVTSDRTATPKPLMPNAPAQDHDSFEFSDVMGAAEGLPGQQMSASASDQIFGVGSSSGDAAPARWGNGADVPDLHAIDGNSPAGAADEMDGKPDSEPADEQARPERDPVSGNVELDEGDQQKVEYLKQRDREVRTHEHAHVAAGGQYVRGGIQFEYETGPDGKRYAVGGEVSIDTSPVSGDPQATIQKAQTVRRAALAPAEPSSQDRRAAAAASQMETKARQELVDEKMNASREAGGNGESETEMDLGAAESAETPETPNAKKAPDAIRADEIAGANSVDRRDKGSAGGLSTLEKTSETPASSVAPGARQKSDSTALSVEPPKSDDRGPGIMGQTENESAGLPEMSVPAAAAPMAKLDYGVRVQQRQLVDLYG